MVCGRNRIMKAALNNMIIIEFVAKDSAKNPLVVLQISISISISIVGV